MVGKMVEKREAVPTLITEMTYEQFVKKQQEKRSNMRATHPSIPVSSKEDKISELIELLGKYNLSGSTSRSSKMIIVISINNKQNFLSLQKFLKQEDGYAGSCSF